MALSIYIVHFEYSKCFICIISVILTVSEANVIIPLLKMVSSAGETRKLWLALRALKWVCGWGGAEPPLPPQPTLTVMGRNFSSPHSSPRDLCDDLWEYFCFWMGILLQQKERLGELILPLVTCLQLSYTISFSISCTCGTANDRISLVSSPKWCPRRHVMPKQMVGMGRKFTILVPTFSYTGLQWLSRGIWTGCNTYYQKIYGHL